MSACDGGCSTFGIAGLGFAALITILCSATALRATRFTLVAMIFVCAVGSGIEEEQESVRECVCVCRAASSILLRSSENNAN